MTLNREKSKKFVVSFSSSAQAMALEDMARGVQGKFEIPGRCIPVPPQISAGCGIAWCVEAQDWDIFFMAVDKYNISYDAIDEVMMY